MDEYNKLNAQIKQLRSATYEASIREKKLKTENEKLVTELSNLKKTASLKANSAQSGASGTTGSNQVNSANASSTGIYSFFSRLSNRENASSGAAHYAVLTPHNEIGDTEGLGETELLEERQKLSEQLESLRDTVNRLQSELDASRSEHAKSLEKIQCAENVLSKHVELEDTIDILRGEIASIQKSNSGSNLGALAGPSAAPAATKPAGKHARKPSARGKIIPLPASTSNPGVDDFLPLDAFSDFANAPVRSHSTSAYGGFTSDASSGTGNNPAHPIPRSSSTRSTHDHTGSSVALHWQTFSSRPMSQTVEPDRDSDAQSPSDPALQAQLTDARQTIATLEAQQVNLQNRLNDIMQKHEAVSGQQDATSAQNTRLESELANALAELASLREGSQIDSKGDEELDAANGRLAEESKTLKATIDRLERELASNAAQTDQLQSINQNLQAEVTLLQNQADRNAERDDSLLQAARDGFQSSRERDGYLEGRIGICTI